MAWIVNQNTDWLDELPSFSDDVTSRNIKYNILSDLFKIGLLSYVLEHICKAMAYKKYK